MINRRRAISVIAGGAILGAIGGRSGASVSQWRGIALGAEARIVLEHPDAENLIAGAIAEIARLENIFSLYRADSQISQLNRDGFLPDPAFEMIELLSICSGLHRRTGGAFDPTVQALWAHYAIEYSSGRMPDKATVAKVMDRVGWQHVDFSTENIRFDQSGVAITLNGIAQGFIADKVADLLRRAGVRNVLVNTGEIVGLGSAPEGDGWNVKLGNGGGRGVILNNTAVATSEALGTTFDTAGTKGHILDPRTGYPAGEKWSRVSVISKSAAIADGLSTACCLLNREQITAATKDEEIYLNLAID